MHNVLAALLVPVVIAVSAIGTQAVSLQELFNGGTLTVGSVHLSGWAPSSSYGNVDPASISVEADDTDPGNPRVVYATFDGSPIIYAENGEGPYINSYFSFGFSVQVLGALSSLASDTFTIESGEVVVDDPGDHDSILITENVADGAFNLLAEKEILCTSPGFMTGILDCSGIFDVDEFAQQPMINVTTYFEVDGGAGLYGYSQSFALVSSSVSDIVSVLAGKVAALNLPQGIGRSLDVKLSTAIHALEDMNADNDDAACSALRSFVNGVEAQSGKLMLPEDAAALVDDARAIMVSLQCD